jgi:2-oxoglutarate dehydrogenase E2 component (dihydrolipoamide succinyltransferase)
VATGTAVDVVMPQMGVSVSEGTVTKWLRQVGEEVRADDPLLEISTDKVDTEVPSPGSGVVQEILVAEGETVAVGTLLARIGGGGAAAPAPPPAPAPSVPEPLPSYVEPEAAAAPEPEPVAAAPEPPAPSGNGSSTGRPAFVSPVVARIAAEHGIDPTAVTGTGRDGRVTKKDILAFVEADAPTKASEPAAPAPPAPAQPEAPPPPPASQPSRTSQEPQVLVPGEELTPMTAMRRGIAEHMRRSLDTAAHVTSAIEVDLSKVVSIRDRLKGEYRAQHGVSLTYLAFIARATVETLAEWPYVNAEMRGESIVTRNFVNLGFAVALDEGKGLIVPVLKHAEDLNLLGMARGVADLAERARTKKLVPDDVQGGTFTITNPGGYGTLIGTPVISQPQSGILGTYALVKRPWVITDDAGQDAIAIRPIMILTLTYDHRLIDGAYAGQFLRDLAGRLQSWGEFDY